MELFLPISTVVLVLIISLGWFEKVRRIPLQDFDLEKVKKVLDLETADVREKIWQRGWMYHKEWLRLTEKHKEVFMGSTNIYSLSKEKKNVKK